MSAVSNVLRQFVQRRLWPVAILLIAALAAVPLALAKEPEVVPPAPVPVADEGEDILASEPIVTQVTAADRAGRRKVIGSSKNPFGFTQEETGSGAAPDSRTTNTADDPVTDVPASDAPATGGTPTTTPTYPGTPTDPVDRKPAKTYDKYDLTVRFGDSSDSLQRMTLKRGQPLPKDPLPAVMYLGVSKDGKSAIFLLEKGVEAVGDGECHPSPQDCETIHLTAGETEFLDVVDDETGAVGAQYQLDIVKIHKSTTASASEASASSKAGRKLLARRVAASGALPYRFDVDSGTLERRPGVVGDVGRTASSLG